MANSWTKEMFGEIIFHNFRGRKLVQFWTLLEIFQFDSIRLDTIYFLRLLVAKNHKFTIIYDCVAKSALKLYPWRACHHINPYYYDLVCHCDCEFECENWKNDRHRHQHDLFCRFWLHSIAIEKEKQWINYWSEKINFNIAQRIKCITITAMNELWVNDSERALHTRSRLFFCFFPLFR